jgi:zinc transporter ZupT
MNIDVVITLVELVLPIVAVAGGIMIVYGVLEYLTTSGDEMSKEEGKNKMFLGSVALVVTAMLWILVNVTQDTI